MNKVIVEVDATKHNDITSEMGESDEPTQLVVRSDPKSNRVVMLVIAGALVSALATDLRAAIDSATNVPGRP